VIYGRTNTFLEVLSKYIEFFMCRVTPLDKGITGIRGLHDAIVKCRTHMLVMLLFEGVTWRKIAQKKFFPI
jgi:hypothetical protein